MRGNIHFFCINDFLTFNHLSVSGSIPVHYDFKLFHYIAVLILLIIIFYLHNETGLSFLLLLLGFISKWFLLHKMDCEVFHLFLWSEAVYNNGINCLSLEGLGK